MFTPKSYFLCITNNEIVQNFKIEAKKILILVYTFKLSAQPDFLTSLLTFNVKYMREVSKKQPFPLSHHMKKSEILPSLRRATIPPLESPLRLRSSERCAAPGSVMKRSLIL